MRLRTALLAATVVLSLTGSTAASAAPSDLLVYDAYGDANGLNDQGSERAVGNVSTATASAPAADLLRLRLSALRDRGHVTGWSVVLRLAGPVGPHSETGQQLSYGMVGQPTPDCRFSIEYITDGPGRGTARYDDSGGCHGPGQPQVLPSTVSGSLLRIDVPYRLLPPDVQPGVKVADISAWVRLAPAGVLPAGELDNILRGHRYRLPR